MENTRLERSECDLRKVMYPVQMWHEYFRITGSRSSKNRPVHRDSFSWIDPFSFRAISLSTMFFASDRNETKIKSNIFLCVTAISSSYFFRSFYSIFFRSRWNLDNTNRRTFWPISRLVTRMESGADRLISQKSLSYVRFHRSLTH